MRLGWILAGSLIVIGIAPVIGLGFVSVMAALGDCRVQDGGAERCVIAGLDWGGLLHWLGSAGWLIVLTAPLALAGFVLGIGLAVTALFRRARR